MFSGLPQTEPRCGITRWSAGLVLPPTGSRCFPSLPGHWLANFSHANLDTCLLVSHWALIWFCLTTHEAEHLFVCLLAIRGWGRT